MIVRDCDIKDFDLKLAQKTIYSGSQLESLIAFYESKPTEDVKVLLKSHIELLIDKEKDPAFEFVISSSDFSMVREIFKEDKIFLNVLENQTQRHVAVPNYPRRMKSLEEGQFLDDVKLVSENKKMWGTEPGDLFRLEDKTGPHPSE